ncbi:MAG: GDP-mannose 4,6-dehydratase [Alphaproteobacteria bacterium]|nr:GDP-mannose 4,6-dehydratase [Alphaproteobacteria bacterium]
MSILLTGAAGFIGYHVAEALLRSGRRVIGIDNLNDYYDVRLKEARLARLQGSPGFVFHRIDIADRDGLFAALQNEKGIRRIVHLAAQAGVRHSLKDPFAYVHSNLQGHMVLLEFARALEKCEHMVYASSSSVYGGNTKLPFSVEDRVDQPVSLYAATKKANELMSYSYSHLFRLPLTGLRFFTVYGPWGRPDMALYIFAKAIVEGRPIEVNNYGDMERDFTYIDDIVSGVLAALDNPPPDREGEAPHRVYNIGNHQPEPLLRLIEILENALGRKAEKIMRPMQPGEVRATYADIGAITRDFGFAPTTPIDKGVPQFVDWFRSYHGI